MRSARYARFFGFYKKLDATHATHDFLDSTKNWMILTIFL
jgi:hypothetical protein